MRSKRTPPAAGPLRRPRVLVSQDGHRPGHHRAFAEQDEVRQGHGCRPADVTRLGIVMVVDRQP
jgi:hypothetical protein